MRRSTSEKKAARTTGNGIGVGIKTAVVVSAVVAAAGIAFYFGTAVHAAQSSASGSPANSKLSSKSLTLPMFFEPNQGQTAPRVKFLARGRGYGLFLTADEAVLQLQPSAVSHQPSASSSESKTISVIRMRLDGADSSARVLGAQLLPGKSNYFIGNDPSKWRQNIPQFAQVEYKNVYHGVDLVYYGDEGHLEYDFRVAPGADTSQIALDFSGAYARIVPQNADDSGDLILSTANGDMRFHAPRIYQPAQRAASASGNSSALAEKAIAGGFRQLAGNKIGFAIGDYDHSRELVIDPVLSYSTYLGGSATEGGLIGSNPENLVKVAVDNGQQIYVAGSTTSTDFPFPIPPNLNIPIQATLKVPTAQNIFIAVLNTNSNVPNKQQLVYATYLGGSLVDSLAGIAVDQNRNIYIAGTTTSPDFPTSASALSGPVSGTHGFLSAITLVNNVYTLTYSTYLAGNMSDTVTGLAIDQNQNAYVTGVTTSSNAASQQSPFPASPSGYQTVSNSPGNPQFFASKIDTVASGPQSMLYSTYFGGGYPANAIAIGGGIAVDPTSPNPNLYITGTTNMLNSLPSGVTAAPFPLLDAQQSCLNIATTTSCPGQTATTTTDAFVAKINPNESSTSSLVYSTYIGAEGNDSGNAIDVDTSGNAYVIGSTNSTLWISLGTGFQTSLGGGFDAYVVKIGNIVGTMYPITYFTYLGGTGDDFGEDIKVDSIGTIHAVGTTGSGDLLFLNPLQPTPGGSQYNGSQYGGQQDAFVALIGSSLSGRAAGDYLTYLGGSNRDQGTGVAFDTFGATYVAGTTISTDFPVTTTTSATTAAYQPQLNNNLQDAFVSKIGANSTLVITVPSTSPSPFPSVPAGTEVTFTFDITNMNPLGTDPASQVEFNVVGLPTTGNQTAPTATVQSGTGSCAGVIGSTISCFIQNLAVNATATVEVEITPAVPLVNPEITIAGNASANGGPIGASVPQPIEEVVDYGITASTSTPVINAGDTATIQVKFCPATNDGYTGTITPSETTSPSMVTATAPTFNPTTVSLSGSACASTTLSIATVARPVSTASLLRRGPFYAAWLPIGGLSLLGLGLGAGRKSRRWLAAAVLGLIAGVLLLQPGCGSASTTTTATGGTSAGVYTITITGTPGPHTTQIRLQVD